MSGLGYDNSFNNIHIDACWLSRRGKLDEAKAILLQNYSNYSATEIDEAIKVGVKMNEALWELSFKRWGKEIEKDDFMKAILGICPELTEDMFHHLYDNAMYDSK